MEVKRKTRGRPPIPGIRHYAVRLWARDIAIAKRQARVRGVSAQEVLREWVAECAKRT